MEHPTPVLRSEKPRIDADFSILAFELRTDNTKRCEVEEPTGDCPDGAAWHGALPDCGHEFAVCAPHRAYTDDWLSRGPLYVLCCKTCGIESESIAWRPL